MCSFPFSSFSKCLSHELHYLNRDLLVFWEQLAPQEDQVKKDREETQEQEENLENRFVHNHYLQCHHPQNVCCQGNKGGTLARVLTSRWSVLPGFKSWHRPDIILWIEFFIFFSPLPWEVFSPGKLVFPSPQKTNSSLTRNCRQRITKLMCYF